MPEKMALMPSTLPVVEKAQQELSDLVYAQRRELDSLTARLTALLQRLQEVESDAGKFDPDAERPPHY